MARHTVYLLPNLLTTLTVCAGFYALTSAASGHITLAVNAIFLGLISDGLDGRVARLVGGQSEFGREYDSLADMVAFGLAPAFLAYEAVLKQGGSWGWSLAFFYAAATALRLARFNTTSDDQKNFFKGLPCPTAAVVCTGSVYLDQLMGSSAWTTGWVVFVTGWVATLMITSVPYPTFKQVQWHRSYTPVAALAGVVVIACLATAPQLMLTLSLTLYALWGMGLMLLRVWKGRYSMRRLTVPTKGG